MCELIGRAIEQAIQRRCLLGGAGATVLAAVLGQPASAAEIAQQEARLAQAKSAAAPFGTRLLGADDGHRWDAHPKTQVCRRLAPGGKWIRTIDRRRQERMRCCAD